MHKTKILCQFGLFCHQLTTISPPMLNHFWWELYQLNKSHCSTPKLTSRIKALFNETKLKLIPFNQIKEPLCLPEHKSFQNKFLDTPHIRYQQNSENSSSHSRYFCSHRMSWKLSPTPTFLQQHSFWTNTHQLYPQSTQAWYT